MRRQKANPARAGDSPAFPGTLGLTIGIRRGLHDGQRRRRLRPRKGWLRLEVYAEPDDIAMFTRNGHTSVTLPRRVGRVHPGGSKMIMTWSNALG